MSPFRIMFPSIGFSGVPPHCCVLLGFYRMQFDMRKIDIPLVMENDKKLQKAVMRLATLSY